MHLTWANLREKRYFIGIINSFLAYFWCYFDQPLQYQQVFFKIQLAVRLLEASGILWLCTLTCLSGCVVTNGAVLPIFGIVALTSTFVCILSFAHDACLHCLARPLFPLVQGWAGGSLELAARLGLASKIAHYYNSEGDENAVAALCQATEAGHVNVIYALVDLDVSTTSTYQGESAIHSAARGGHLDTFKALGSQNFHTANIYGATPAFIAAQNGHLEVLKFLKASGCNLETADNNGWTPAHIAAQNGHLEVLKFLKASGCNLETADNDGWTPAYIAARNGHLEVLKLLKASGCNLETASNNGWTPACSAAQNGHLEVLQFLKASGCNLETANNNGLTPACSAAQNGHLEVLQFLKASGCNLETANNNGWTPACVAAQNGHLEVLQFLKASGCNLETASNDGWTPAYIAARNGHLEVLKLLKASGCNLETANNNGWTPACFAAQNGHLEVLQFLKASGCILGVKTLHVAVENGHDEVVKFLVPLVDVNAPGPGGARALDIARATANSDLMCNVLLEAGAVSAPRPLCVGLTALKPREPPTHGGVWFTSGLPQLAQSKGQFYYEIEFLSDFAAPQCGWLSADFEGGEEDGHGVGDDVHGWGFDGQRCLWWHNGERKPLNILKWTVHDVLGFSVDLDQGQMQLHTKQGVDQSMPFQAPSKLQLDSA